MKRDYISYISGKKIREFVREHFGPSPDEFNLDYTPSSNVCKSTHLGPVFCCDYVQSLNDYEPSKVIRTVYIGSFGIVTYWKLNKLQYIPATQDGVYKDFYEFMTTNLYEVRGQKCVEEFKKDFIFAHKKALKSKFKRLRRDVKFDFKEELENLSFGLKVAQENLISEFTSEEK